MSVQALNELYFELNRITIAGVNLAKSDYRISRLIPLFKKSGESAPVFNKVATLTEKLTTEETENRSTVLLDLLNLVIAMLSTLGKTGITGELIPIDFNGLDAKTSVSYRKLKPVIDALEQSGSGRIGIITNAYQEGIFSDSRTIIPLIHALGDSIKEVHEFAMSRLIELGSGIIPVIKTHFNPLDAKYRRVVHVIAKVAGASENEWYRQLLNDETHEEILSEAILALRFHEQNLDLVLEYTSHKKKAIRQAAYEALGFFNDLEVTNAYIKAFDKKDRDILKEGIKNYHSHDLNIHIIDRIHDTVERLCITEKFKEAKTKNTPLPYSEKEVSLIYDGLDILSTKNDDQVIHFYSQLSHYMGELIYLEAPKSSIYKTVGELFADSLLAIESHETLAILHNLAGIYNHYYLKYTFVAATFLDDPKVVFNTYAKYVKNGSKDLVSTSIIDVFYYLAANMDYPSNHILITAFKKTIDKVDKRWLDVFIELDNLPVVTYLAHSESKTLADYLMKKANVYIERNYMPWDLIKTLLIVEAKHTHKFVLEVIDKVLMKQNHYLKLNFDVIQLLPSKYAKDLEKLGTKYANSELIEFAKRMN